MKLNLTEAPYISVFDYNVDIKKCVWLQRKGYPPLFLHVCVALKMMSHGVTMTSSAYLEGGTSCSGKRNTEARLFYFR